MRQAVRCPIVEGALEMLLNRTMQVPRMTRDRLAELLGVRRALEGIATEPAVRKRQCCRGCEGDSHFAVITT